MSKAIRKQGTAGTLHHAARTAHSVPRPTGLECLIQLVAVKQGGAKNLSQSPVHLTRGQEPDDRDREKDTHDRHRSSWTPQRQIQIVVHFCPPLLLLGSSPNAFSDGTGDNPQNGQSGCQYQAAERVTNPKSAQPSLAASHTSPRLNMGSHSP